MVDIETQMHRQKGICADCPNVITNPDEQGGLLCHECNKLYCARCYSKVHARHNMKMWTED